MFTFCNKFVKISQAVNGQRKGIYHIFFSKATQPQALNLSPLLSCQNFHLLCGGVFFKHPVLEIRPPENEADSLDFFK